MKTLLATLVSLILVNSANAQTFKVIKIQGKKAIVEMNDPKLVKLNETYSVGAETVVAAPVGKTGNRNYAIDVTFNFSSFNSISTTILGGAFLWNMKVWEAGPILSFASVSGGGSNSSSTAFGATGYYNFIENKPGVEGIPSVIATITTSSGSGISNSTSLSAGGNYRWFILSGDHAFSASALYSTTQTSGASTSGFVINGGIVTYF